MPRTSANQLVRSQLDEDGRQNARFCNLQIDWVRYKSGTPIARFGGRWDREDKVYDGDCTTSRVIEIHATQIEAVDRFDRWLTDHLLGGSTEIDDRIREIIQQDLDYSAELGALLGLKEMYLSGGRRSGKTFIMEGILTSYAITVPDAIVWTVTPSEQFHEEPRRNLVELMPSDWYSYNGDPQYTFTLANGSEHVLRSGHSPGSLKKGRAALVGLNEAQQIKPESYRNARGATVDNGGFALVACNPPISGDYPWVLDAVAGVEKGDRYGAEHYFCDPLDNPHVDIGALLALKSSMTLHDWETQIRGRMLQLPDVVLYTWSRAVNERPAPDFGRITREFLTAHEGDRAKWDKLIVIDVQGYPWIACGIFDVFRDPRDPKNMKAGLLWMVDEVAISQGDEVDVCEELKRRGYDGERTLVIMDASCFWQQMQRDKIAQRPEYKGKGSADMFKKNGFPHVVAPDRSMKSNPDVMERIRATNATVKPADEIAGMFIDDRKCPNGVESARKWRMKKGKPHRRENAAHFGDVLGYATWRFFPRRGTASKLLSEGLTREHGELGGMESEGGLAGLGPGR